MNRKKKIAAAAALVMMVGCLSGQAGCATRDLKNIIPAKQYEPADPYAGIIGQTLSFETTDVDGNAVTSEELFKDNEITMVNLWGTWCYYCVEEIEELTKIHERLQEKGCGIVGVECEQEPIDTIVDEIHAFMEEKGMNYPNVILPEENAIFRMVTGFPTTFFVDSDGTILTGPIVGALVDQYESTVDELLDNMKADEQADTETAEIGITETGTTETE